MADHRLPKSSPKDIQMVEEMMCMLSQFKVDHWCWQIGLRQIIAESGRIALCESGGHFVTSSG